MELQKLLDYSFSNDFWVILNPNIFLITLKYIYIFNHEPHFSFTSVSPYLRFMFRTVAASP